MQVRRKSFFQRRMRLAIVDKEDFKEEAITTQEEEIEKVEVVLAEEALEDFLVEDVGIVMIVKVVKEEDSEVVDLIEIEKIADISIKTDPPDHTVRVETR